MHVPLLSFFLSVSRFRYAVVLKKLELLKEAIDVFVEAVAAEPMLWCAWLELAMLVNSRDMVSSGHVLHKVIYE